MDKETQNLAEQKLALAQAIFNLHDSQKLAQIQSFVEKLTDERQEAEHEYNAKLLTFDEWNKQFDDDYNPDDYIPEYGMTLHEYRMKIYQAEKEEGMSKEHFSEKVKNWK